MIKEYTGTTRTLDARTEVCVNWEAGKAGSIECDPALAEMSVQHIACSFRGRPPPKTRALKKKPQHQSCFLTPPHPNGIRWSAVWDASLWKC
eukprot:1160945-Pelagomonas_calceolata.AAC.2